MLPIRLLTSQQLAYSATVQWMVSTFPRGIAGFALLLLRVAVAALLLAAGQWRALVLAPHPLTFLAFGLVFLLCLGLVTPFVAFVSLLEQCIYLANAWDASSIGTCVVTVLLCVALTLLGPGDYSLDALIYGRRRIVLPDE